MVLAIASTGPAGAGAGFGAGLPVSPGIVNMLFNGGPGVGLGAGLGAAYASRILAKLARIALPESVLGGGSAAGEAAPAPTGSVIEAAGAFGAGTASMNRGDAPAAGLAVVTEPASGVVGAGVAAAAPPAAGVGAGIGGLAGVMGVGALKPFIGSGIVLAAGDVMGFIELPPRAGAFGIAAGAISPKPAGAFGIAAGAISPKPAAVLASSGYVSDNFSRLADTEFIPYCGFGMRGLSFFRFLLCITAVFDTSLSGFMALSFRA